MNPHDVSLVKNSFRQILPISDQAAALLYARLFEIDPSFRTLFRGDMQEQGRQFMHLLGEAVASGDRLHVLMPTLRELGVKHAGCGVGDRHYVMFGTALMWTLEKGLGPTFTVEVRAAWSAFYATLAHAMLHAGKNAA